MDNNLDKNIFTQEAKRYFLNKLESPNKDLIKNRVFESLYTRYPQVFKTPQPVFLLFITQRYVVGAFLVLLVFGTAFAADLVKVTPGDNIPYVTKSQIQEVKLRVLNVFNNQAADEYQNKLVARKLEDFSNTVLDPHANSISIVVVSKNLADRLGEYSGGKFSPNQTEFALLDTVKKVNLALDNARKVLVQKDQGAEEKTQISESLDEVSRIGNEVLRQQVELKLAESRRANQASKDLIEAELAYQRGDFVAALEKLELSQNSGVVQGEQVAVVDQPLQASAMLEFRGEASTTSQAVVVGIKPSVSKKDSSSTSQQIEYVVGLEL